METLMAGGKLGSPYRRRGVREISQAGPRPQGSIGVQAAVRKCCWQVTRLEIKEDKMNKVSETHNVIHRDVKPSNILLDWNGSVKLCDFGISGQLIESRAHTVQAGCPPYMAPERFDPRFNSDYDIRSDVWSVGISLVEIATGRYPYSHIDSEFAILAAIVRDPSPTLPMCIIFHVEYVHIVPINFFFEHKELNIRDQAFNYQQNDR
uniref:mitogen-activated protein kinase kinase n=1 Tax=Haemonchus contortus TaxID=6289 RepID=W6NVQ9_HAECO